MKLDVSLGDRLLRDGDYLIVSPRAALELQLDGAGSDAPAATQLQVVLTLSQRPIRPQEFEVATADRASTPPGVAFRSTLRCWPLSDSVWVTKSLCIELKDATRATLASRRLRLIPSPHARLAQAWLLASVALSLLIAWPAFHVKPASFGERAFQVVFGAPLILLAGSALVSWLKQLLHNEPKSALDAGWRLMGGLPPLFTHALAASLMFIAGISVLVDRFVVIYVNHAGHDLHFAWAPHEVEPLEKNGTRALLTLDPRALFRRTWQAKEPHARHCLAGLEEPCRPLNSAAVPVWEAPFALATVAEIVCRDVVWTEIEQHLAAEPQLEAADIVHGQVRVELGPDCAPLAASAWLDADSLERVDAAPAPQPSAAAVALPVTRSYRLAFNAQHPSPPSLDSFVQLEVQALGANARSLLPLRIASERSVDTRFLAAQAEIRAPEALERSLALRVPARASQHRIELTIGPVGSSPWGTLHCFPRGSSQLSLWLLPLEDSTVSTLRAEFSNGIVSSWKAALSDSGELSPLVAVCLPSQGQNSSPRLDLELVTRGGGYDAPQFLLPAPLGKAVLRISTNDGARQSVATVTCNYDDTGVRLVRATGLRPPTDQGELSLFEGASTPKCEAPQKVPAGALRRAVWNGRGTPLACLPALPAAERAGDVGQPAAAQGARCYPVQPSWGAFACAFDPAHPEQPCAPRRAERCILDRFGDPPRGPCGCNRVPARDWFTRQELEKVAKAGCPLDTAQACPC